jgi:hypothetical protein
MKGLKVMKGFKKALVLYSTFAIFILAFLIIFKDTASANQDIDATVTTIDSTESAESAPVTLARKAPVSISNYSDIITESADTYDYSKNTSQSQTTNITEATPAPNSDTPSTYTQDVPTTNTSDDSNTTTNNTTPITETNDSNAGITNYVIIGDSRTVHIKATVGEQNHTWACKTSMGLKWMKSEAVPSVENKITKGTAVIILMGVNDLYNSKNYIEYINISIPVLDNRITADSFSLRRFFRLWKIRAVSADTLPVLPVPAAGCPGDRHADTEFLLTKISRAFNRQSAGAFAAAGSADSGHDIKASCRQSLWYSPLFSGQRCCAADNAGKDTGTCRRPADAKETAGAAAHLLSPLPGFLQAFLIIDPAAVVAVCRDQNTGHDTVMFGTVHMYRIKPEDLMQKKDRIFFVAASEQIQNCPVSAAVACVTDKMPVFTDGIGRFQLMTAETFQHHFIRKIMQRLAADHTVCFFICRRVTATAILLLLPEICFSLYCHNDFP